MALGNTSRWLALRAPAMFLLACSSFAPPPDLSGTNAPCCDGLGSCLPTALVPSQFQTMVERASCAEALSCVPRELLSGQDARPASCVSSVLGAEGRCLPACLPAVRPRANDLAQDGCGGGRLCVPCYDPISGASTGACNLGRDPGASGPPSTFGVCCTGNGRCIPRDRIPGEIAGMLGALDCPPAGDQLCVAPRGLVETGASFVSASCADDVLGSEGRCLPACLPFVAAQATRLRQAGCGPSLLCVPCFDPLTGMQTGACELGGDPGPTQPPRVFEACCQGLGRCAPAALVPAAQASQLDADVCDQSKLCVAPKALLLSPQSARLAACYDPQLQMEGRCVPACLPLVRQRRDVLGQHGCEQGTLCAPCFDPISGQATGACSVGGDLGPSQPPASLPACCGGAGKCTPRGLVPENVAKQLGPDDCPATQDSLCVAPLAALTDPTGFRPPACVVPAVGAEGRCLPACLPQVSAQRDRLQRGDCPEANLCVPCFDPFLGTATGACTNNGDAPHTPAQPFAGCCVVGGQALGVCLPPALLPAEGPALPQETCSAGTSCAPRSLAVDPTARLSSCTALGNAGACLPSCFLDPAQALLFPRGTCADGEACVFCDLLGSSTGVCDP